MSTLANCEDQDEMQHIAEIHQGLQTKMIFREKNTILFGNFNS